MSRCPAPAVRAGAIGTIVERQGRYPLPDHRARRLPAELEPVYAVRFDASELFGEGDHTVTVDLWESYLRPGCARGDPMSADHAGPAATLAARVRRVEGLLERRGLVDSQELDRAQGCARERSGAGPSG